MLTAFKKFLKPGWVKIVIFAAIFTSMFYGLPFLKDQTGKSKTFFLAVKNYGGTRQEFYYVIFGLVIYLLAAYFISCAAIQIWNDLRGNKKTQLEIEKKQ